MSLSEAAEKWMKKGTFDTRLGAAWETYNKDKPSRIPYAEFVRRYKAFEKCKTDEKAANLLKMPKQTFFTWRRRSGLPAKSKWGGYRPNAGRKEKTA